MMDTQAAIGQAAPTEWRVAPLWALFRRVKETDHISKPLLSVYRDHGVLLAASRDDNHNTPSEDLSAYQLVKQGSLVTNKMKTWQGSIAISRYEGIVSPAYFVYQQISRQNDRYLHYLLRSAPYIALYKRLSKGIRVGQWDLEQNAFRTIPILIPPLEEQTAIAGYLDRETARIDGLIEKKTRFIALLNDKEKAAISRFVRAGIDPDANMIDSGVEWRGKVPAHWTRGRMKNHFKQVKRQGYDDLTVLSVYREFGVIEKSSRTDNINKTPEDLSKYQLVKPNDLAINKMKAWQGSMGVSALRGITSPDYVVMTPVGEHNPRYMHHYVRARPMPWVYRLISNGIRTDQWRMEPEKFLELPVFLPPLEEQQRIAERIDLELERIRGLIANTNRSIALLREKRAALITAAVTGKIDVRHMA